MAVPQSGKSPSGTQYPATQYQGGNRHIPQKPDLTEHSPKASEEFGMSELAASLSSNVADAAMTATRAAREQAVELAENVGEELGKVAEDKKQHGAEAMHTLAEALERVASELEGQAPRVALYAREAADKIDTLSDNIAGRDITELSRAMSELARSNPLAFFGASVAAGFALSRFLKSSSGHLSERPGGRPVAIHG